MESACSVWTSPSLEVQTSRNKLVCEFARTISEQQVCGGRGKGRAQSVKELILLLYILP